MTKRLLYLSIILGVLFSCKKFYDPPLVFEQAEEAAIPKKRKVLLIVADGAISDAVKTIMPPNISKLLEHAKYSWNAYGDANTTDGGSWVGLTSGKVSTAYGVVDSSLNISNGEGNEENHGTVSYIPNYSQRLLASGKIGAATSKMVVISPWQTLLDVPYKFADRKIYADNDAKVKDSALRVLKDASITHLVVNFNRPNIIGKQYGFAAGITQYKEAVNTVDSQIGEIMNALKSRATYNAEDWLVILTTTHGVSSTDITRYDGGTLDERKIFFIYNNDNIKKQEFSSLSSYQTFPFTTRNQIAALDAAKSSVYALGASGNYTILSKVRMLTKPTGSNHTVLAYKSNHAYSGVNGWNMMITGGTGLYRFVIGAASKALLFVGGGAEQASGPAGSWDVVALKVFDSASKRWAVCMTNGKRSTPIDITGYDIGASSTPFALGTITNSVGAATFNLKDFSIWNTALPDQYIANYRCGNGITANDPMLANLIGYWPVEGSGTTVINKAPNASDKNLTSNFPLAWTWVPGADCSGGSSVFISSTDIVPTIFYWLNTKVIDSWGLEGNAWLKDYETEFVK